MYHAIFDDCNNIQLINTSDQNQKLSQQLSYLTKNIFK